MPDMKSGSSEASNSHYWEEDVVYCGSDYRLGKAEEDEEAVLCALTTKIPDLPLPDVEVLDVARFCETKQDHPCHLRCPNGGAERGRPHGMGTTTLRGKRLSLLVLAAAMGPPIFGPFQKLRRR